MQTPILSRSTSDQRSSTAPAARQTLHCNPALGLALEHGLELPLSALRASMESLQHGIPEGAAVKRSINGALKKVELISRNIHDLMDLANPPSPMPVRCTALEIAKSARGSLPPEQSSRVLLANLTAETSVHVDAPLVTRCLRRLIDNAFEAGTDFVLLTLRSDEHSTAFAVVDGAPASFDEGWAMTAFHSNKRHHMGLGLALVKRDMELLSGCFSIEHTPNGETMATLTLPNEACAPEVDAQSSSQSNGASA